MDNKAWPWKRKSTEKTILTDDRASHYTNINEDEKHSNDKAQHEKDLTILNEKLTAALSECNARQDFAKKQATLAQEAIAGWEKAEAEVVALKIELEKYLQQKIACEEKVNLLDGALKECMQQLRFVREDQEKRILDAVKKASKEFESSKAESDKKLAEAAKRLGKVEAENVQLSKALISKETVIAELCSLKARAEADHEALMARIKSTEKENSSLKYEVRVLEKELEIRNEEREFNHRSADVSHKQHLENVKKIGKLESECHKLRVLVSKRLPGPAALTKMKNEVKMLGKDQLDTTIKRSSSSLFGSTDSILDMGADAQAKTRNFPIQQVLFMEKENRTLEDAVDKTINESHTPRILHSHAASPLSQPDGSLMDDTVAELGKTIHSGKGHSLTSVSDMGSDDKVSCADSWTSALVSELEQFKSGKDISKASSIISGGFSDMSLMDDFVQMEKLAVVSAENSFPSYDNVIQIDAAPCHPVSDSKGNAQEAVVTEILPLHDMSNVSSSKPRNHSENRPSCVFPTSLAEIVQIFVEKCQELQRNPNEMLEEIKATLAEVNHHNSELLDNKERCKPYDVLCSPKVVLEEPPVNPLTPGSSLMGSCNNNIQAKKNNQKPQSSLSVSIQKIIELIEGISMQLPQDCNSEMSSINKDRCLGYKNSETSTGYLARLFQWKSSELSTVLEQFVQACNDLLSERYNVEEFAERLTSTLAWVMDHCFSLQDVSSMEVAIKNHFDWNESRSESEVDIGRNNPLWESDKINVQEEVPPSTFASIPYCQNGQFHVEEVQLNCDTEKQLEDESPELPDNESARRNLDGKLEAEISAGGSLMIQPQDSSRSIESKQTEVHATMKQFEIKDQSQGEKLVKDDLEAQQSLAKDNLSEALEKQTCLEAQLVNKNNGSQRSKATCHDVQFHQESMEKKEVEDEMEHLAMQLRTDLEITAASEKLAECQETILNLGKQLKALAPSKESASSPKVIASPADTVSSKINPLDKTVHHRTSLLDKMLAEDKADIEVLKPAKTKELILHDHGKSAFSIDTTSETLKRLTDTIRVDNGKRGASIVSSSVSNKKRTGGLLRKLFCKETRST